MAITVFPIQPNQFPTESLWTGANSPLAGVMSRRVSGFDLSDGGGLNLSVAAGVATISGRRIESDAGQTLALDDDTANRVWMTATGTLYANASNTPTSAEDLHLGRVQTASGSITSILASNEIVRVGGVGVALTGGRKSFVALDATGTSTALQTDATLPVGAGLYWIRGCVCAQGTAFSAGQSIQVQLDVSGAGHHEIQAALLAHADEGASDESAWTTGGASVSFGATSNNILFPIHIVGRVWVSDAADLLINVGTSSHFFTRVGHLTAVKLA